MNKKIKTLVVTGPTASGKTSLAVSLSLSFGGEIISADSRQVYIGMDIGTGKDIVEYTRDGRSVPYHLIDVEDPVKGEYNLSRFYKDAVEAIRKIDAKGALPVICGGSTLYVHSVLSGYRMEGGPPDSFLRAKLEAMSAEEIASWFKSERPDAFETLKDKGNKTRLIRAAEKAFSTVNADYPDSSSIAEFLVLAPYYKRKEAHRRIEARLDARLNSGMLDEAIRLHDAGLSWQRMEYLGLEYRYMALHLQGKISYSEMRDTLFIHIRQFVKRQDIWFRKMEREGLLIHWIPDGDSDIAASLVRTWLDGGALPEPVIRLKDIDYGKQGF